MNLERQGFHISHVYSLWQDLSHHSINFDPVILTLKFDLLFKNFNLGHNLWPQKRHGFHISHVYSQWQDLSLHSIIFDLVTLILNFDLLFKNFNHSYNLWTVRDRDFIFHICIPCDNTFHTIPYFLTDWPWLELSKTFTKRCYFNLVASRQTSLSFLTALVNVIDIIYCACWCIA